MPADQSATARYPSAADIENATLQQLLAWNRFLPTPTTGRELGIADRVVARLALLRFQSPSSYVAASRDVGWEA